MSPEDTTPVLDDIVKRGDENVIKAARLEREILEELNRMAPRQANTAPAAPSPAKQASQVPLDGTLEQAIDSIVQYHCDAMREEVQQLLRDRLG